MGISKLPQSGVVHVKQLGHVHAETRCRLFAADTLLYRVVETIADQVQSQQDLKNLEQWATTWGMVFNQSKCYICYIMSVDKGKTQKSHFYELCGVVLKSVYEKYLGVILYCHKT